MAMRAVRELLSFSWGRLSSKSLDDLDPLGKGTAKQVYSVWIMHLSMKAQEFRDHLINVSFVEQLHVVIETTRSILVLPSKARRALGWRLFPIFCRSHGCLPQFRNLK
jgi:hypothetical protein